MNVEERKEKKKQTANRRILGDVRSFGHKMSLERHRCPAGLGSSGGKSFNHFKIHLWGLDNN